CHGHRCAGPVSRRARHYPRRQLIARSTPACVRHDPEGVIRSRQRRYRCRFSDRLPAEPRRCLPATYRACFSGGGGMTALVHTGLLTGRHLRAFVRQPVFLGVNVLQPLLWLLLFGQLFKSVVDIPGFSGGDDYLVFLTPGIVMMMAMFASAWAGTTFIEDMNIGVMDRLLTSPTNRGGLIVATMWYQAVLTIMQT